MYLNQKERKVDDQAEKIIELEGEKGYAAAAELVGPDRVDAILHNHIWWQIKNSKRIPDSMAIVTLVRGIRKAAGFSPRPQFEQLRIYPATYSNSDVQLQPGELSRFAPYGNGVYGGYQPREEENFFRQAPDQEPSGGLIFFGNEMGGRELRVFFRILKINPDEKRYAAFVSKSEIPGREGYLEQIRIVSIFGLRFFFKVVSEQEYDSFPEQEITACEALQAFMSKERTRWGTSFTDDGKGLGGLFGGDGDFAREQLAFGFMLENQYFSIYRLWSRAWLVTK